jgi:putative ABC transport system ATP-binding protein
MAQRRRRPRDSQSRPVVLSVRGLRRAYREGGHTREVLNGVDLDVRRGECVALLGRSGSGKSTLLNLVSGIDRPDAGAVLIDGVDLTRLDERRRTLLRRRHIGFVYQFHNLIPTLTVEENLLLPLDLNGIERRASTEAVSRLLAEVGLADRRATWPDRLSGGEQQRVAIARALAHDPALVLADEPTGTLDADTGRHVLSLFERLVRARGKTLILVTHSREVTRFADRVLLLEDGLLSERPAEVVW